MIARSTSGETAVSTIWNSQICGRATKPSTGWLRLKSAARCFQRHCRVPNDQRKRCFKSPETLSGASV